jgi:hypothetical protein
MGLNLAAMEKITADVQMDDIEWVEVGPGSYFKVLTVHAPTNTVAFGYKMDPGAPDFPSHFHICRAMAWTVKGWYGYRESENPAESRITTGMFSYEAAGSFHTPFSDCPEGFQTVGIFEGDTEILLQNHAEADPQSERIGDLTVSDFIEWSSPSTHIVHLDGSITGDPTFKYDFTSGVNAFKV